MKNFTYAALKTIILVGIPFVVLCLTYYTGKFFENLYRTSNNLIFFSGLVQCYLFPCFVFGISGMLLFCWVDDVIEKQFKIKK